MKEQTKFLVQIAVTTNIIEWYGFCITAYLSIEFGELFFKTNNTALNIFLAISIFSISYLTRPLGGFFFGYIGDYYGRTYSLKLSTLLMIIPTVMVGLLPIYKSIGFYAPLILVILRLIQGFSAGGELPGTACYVYEAANIHNRRLLCSSISISSMLGVLLASFIVSVLHAMFTQREILSWAWRLPFFLAVPLAIWIYHIRDKLSESSQSIQVEGSTKFIKNKSFLLITIYAVIITSFLQICFYILFVWFPFYLEYYLKISSKLAHLTNTVALISLVIFTFVASYFSKSFSHKKMIRFSIIGIILFTYPLFTLLIKEKVNFYIVLLIQILFALFVSFISGIIMEFLGNLYSSNVRSRGMSISFTLASSLFGGTAPVLCTFFINFLGKLIFPSIYIIMFGCLSILLSLFLDVY